MRVCGSGRRLGFPVGHLIDTPGAYPGVGREQRGQSVPSRTASAEHDGTAGAGGRDGDRRREPGGALAIGVADRVLMQQNTTYTGDPPEGCAAILWKDAGEAKRAAAALRSTAESCLELGVVDAIVPEPSGAAPTATTAKPRRCLAMPSPPNSTSSARCPPLSAATCAGRSSIAWAPLPSETPHRREHVACPIRRLLQTVFAAALLVAAPAAATAADESALPALTSPAPPARWSSAPSPGRSGTGSHPRSDAPP